MSEYIQVSTTGAPWGEAERKIWLSRQIIQRTYQDEIVVKIDALRSRDIFDIEQYGALSHDVSRYPLFTVKTRNWDSSKKIVLVTGGVHGYETSGVQGAIRFIETEMEKYSQQFNIIVFPCVSPWGYETINRWNAIALDPNRNFTGIDSPAEECANVIKYLGSMLNDIHVHCDLHETTDTDNSQFRPALAERDGKTLSDDDWSEIPDGFYSVGDSTKPADAFQKAIIAVVKTVTHIAPTDANGCIIGEKLVSPGVIHYPARELGLCMGVSEAAYVTTTEVYPDSPKSSPENCILAQVAVVTSGLDYVLGL